MLNLATDNNMLERGLNQAFGPGMASIFGEKKMQPFEIEPLPWMKGADLKQKKHKKAKKPKQPKPDADFSPTFEIEPMPGFDPSKTKFKTKKSRMRNGAKLKPRMPVKRETG